MKKLLVLLGSLLVVFVGLVAFIAVKAGSLLTAYKPTIEQKISQALGVQVSIGAIDLSILPSIHLTVSDVAFRNHEGAPLPFSLRSLKAGLRVLPLLVSRTVEITSIELVEPQLSLVKDRNGVGIQGLQSTIAREQKPAAPLAAPSMSDSNQAPTALSMMVNKVFVTGGSLTVVDTTSSKSLTAKQIELAAGLQMQGDVVTVPSASLGFALVGAAPLLTITSEELEFNKSAKRISWKQLNVATDFGSLVSKGAVNLSEQSGGVTISSEGISLDALARSLSPLAPSLPSMEPSGALGFSLTITNPTAPSPALQGTVSLKQVAVAPQPGSAITAAEGHVAISGSPLALNLSTDNLALRYQNTPLTISMAAQLRDNKILEIASCALSGWGGRTTLTGSLSAPAQRPIRIDLSASELSVSALMSAFKPELREVVSGTVTRFATKVSTATPTNNLPMALQGPGEVQVRNGTIKGSNLAAAVVAKLNSLPFIGGALRAQVPASFTKYLDKPDTDIKELRADYSLQSGVVTLRSFSLISDIFSIDGNGSVTFSGDLNLNTTIYFTKEFSQALAQQARDTKKLLAADGRLIIPLTIQGRWPALLLTPNLGKIIETGAARELQEKALSAIDKALGGKKGRESAGPSTGRPSNLGKALRGLGF